MILNLDKSFQPLSEAGKSLSFETFTFPSKCEVHIKLTNPEKEMIRFIGLFRDPNEPIYITTRIKSSDDIMRLLLATNAIHNTGEKNICVFIPYMPYARQDRVMVTGEPLSIKVFASLLNLQNYVSVTTYDVHSEVSLACINNSYSISNTKFVQKVLEDKLDYLICSPDAGAYKKIFKLCQEIEYKDEIVLCNKIRNVKNGHIINIDISNTDLQGKDVYIIDDISDGGGTFTLLAEKLKMKNCGKVFLIVSHGIFSKGIELLIEKGVDHIYTTDSFQDLPEHKNLTQIKLQNIL